MTVWQFPLFWLSVFALVGIFVMGYFEWKWCYESGKDFLHWFNEWFFVIVLFLSCGWTLYTLQVAGKASYEVEVAQRMVDEARRQLMVVKASLDASLDDANRKAQLQQDVLQKVLEQHNLRYIPEHPTRHGR